MVSPVANHISNGDIDEASLFFALLFAVLILGVVGMMVSLFVHRRLSGIFLGAMVGSLMGIVVGPICLMPQEGFTHLLVISMGGGVALLSIGAVARLTSNRRTVATSVGDEEIIVAEAVESADQQSPERKPNE